MWCYEAGHCEPGDSQGAIDRQCVHWDFQECRDDRCILYSECDLCADDNTCVWCEDGYTCEDIEAPQCEESFSFLNNEQCPGSGDTDPDLMANMTTEEIQGHQEELQSLQDQARQLESEIARTQGQIDSLSEGTTDLVSQTPPTIAVGGNTDGVSMGAGLTSEWEQGETRDVIDDAGASVVENFEATWEAKQQEIESIKTMYASFDQDDYDEWLEVVDPDAEFNLDEDDFSSFLKIFGAPDNDSEEDV